MASDKAKEPAPQGQSKIDIELEQTLIGAVDAIMSGDDRKAMEMADNGFNWMRLSQGFNRGVMMAVHDAAQGLTYVLKHPIDAISGLARTAWNVAEVCGPILEKFSQNVDNFDAMSSEEQNQVLEKAAADIREKAASVIQDWAALSTEEQGEIIGNALTHLGLSVGGGVAAAKVTSKIAAFASELASKSGVRRVLKAGETIAEQGVKHADDVVGIYRHIQEGQRAFKSNEAVRHFEKHGNKLMKALGKNSYNLEEYINDANHVIKTGQFVPEKNAYVKILGGPGQAKVAFVGVDQKTGAITTFHIKSVGSLAKEAPSLGWKK